jgi:glycosyltransferase involved in cell wall biosynthesis
LILNLDDSPTCTDMHPSFPTRLHFRLARALEDYYARCADAIVYVSERNLEAVRARQPKDVQQRFHLVRYGADLERVAAPPRHDASFEIAYVGAMSGWWALIGRGAGAGRARRAYDAWSRLGRFERTALDQQTSSPAVIGAAIHEAIAGRPEWTGKVQLTVHGNPYPPELVARALAARGIDDVVAVTGPVPHVEVAAIMAAADLLFLTLPRRVDGSPGGRISAKTYEYLATDRPILAAVPRGENWDYLEGKPGVWLVEPDDHAGMSEIIAELASAKFAGAARSFDRSQLRPQLSYTARATQFDAAVRAGIEHASSRGQARTGG